MGWTVVQDDEDLSRIEMVERELFSGDEGYDVVAKYTHGTTVYLAVKLPPNSGRGFYVLDDDQRATIGIVVLTERKHGQTFSYKQIDEMMGPYYWDAPRALIDRLSPLKSVEGSWMIESAEQWRAKCRQQFA